jgi:hypothetical protein
VIFVTQDVGQHDEVAAFLDQAHRDAGHRAFSGTPASISASEEPQTEAIDEEPFDSVISETTRTVYGNSSIVGDGQHAALGQAAVADFAALGRAEAAALAHRERREVVVEQEVVLVLAGTASMIWPSRAVPSVMTTMAWVSPGEQRRTVGAAARRPSR